MEQKIIIRSNNLLFQFSDLNNNLVVLNLWKSTRSVIVFLIRSRGSGIKLYFFSCCICPSIMFFCEFFAVFDSSGLVYTPRKLHVVFPHIFNLLKPNREKYHNLKKKFTLFNSVYIVRDPRENKTLTTATFRRKTKHQK